MKGAAFAAALALLASSSVKAGTITEYSTPGDPASWRQGLVVPLPCFRGTLNGSILSTCDVLTKSLREKFKKRSLDLMSGDYAPPGWLATFYYDDVTGKKKFGDYLRFEFKKACDLLSPGQAACSEQGCRVDYSATKTADYFLFDSCSCRKELAWLRGAWVRNFKAQWKRLDWQIAHDAVTIPKLKGTASICEPFAKDYLTLYKRVKESPVLRLNREVDLAKITKEHCATKPSHDRGPASTSGGIEINAVNDHVAACHLLNIRDQLEAAVLAIVSCVQLSYAMGEHEHFFLKGRKIAGEPVSVLGALHSDVGRACIRQAVRWRPGQKHDPARRFQECYDQKAPEYFTRYLSEAGGQYRWSEQSELDGQGGADAK